MNYVDLGLSIKWSSSNTGTDNPYEFGEYRSFEDIRDYTNLPTIEQWKELQKECKFKFDKEKNGVKVTGKNGNEIFFPFAGEKNGHVEDRTVGAFFLSKTECEYDDGLVYFAYVSKKVFSNKLKVGTGTINKNNYFISIRTVETGETGNPC